jgi:hypothetical protein
MEDLLMDVMDVARETRRVEQTSRLEEEVLADEVCRAMRSRRFEA